MHCGVEIARLEIAGPINYVCVHTRACLGVGSVGVHKKAQAKSKGPISVCYMAGPVSSVHRVPRTINSQFSGQRPCLGGGLRLTGSPGRSVVAMLRFFFWLPSAFSTKCHRTSNHAFQLRQGNWQELLCLTHVDLSFVNGREGGVKSTAQKEGSEVL